MTDDNRLRNGTDSLNTLADPFDSHTSLIHCGCGHKATSEDSSPLTDENVMDRTVESAVVKALFQGNELTRRRFMGLVGSSTALSIISSLFPLDAAKHGPRSPPGRWRKRSSRSGLYPFIRISLHYGRPHEVLREHGLVGTKVIKAAGWAMIRDWAMNKEVDCAHMLSPMPLALTMGAGSTATPFMMPAVENINGQAITLHMKHKDVKGPRDYERIHFLCAL